MREDYCLEDAAGLPEGTDFCVIAESDCMEPYIKRGGRVCVSRKQTPAEGEERGQCRCLGRVLTDKKLPMPIYGAAEKSP